MESHRLCEVQWSKFGRNIAVELALDPKRRKPANDFLKVWKGLRKGLKGLANFGFFF